METFVHLVRLRESSQASSSASSLRSPSQIVGDTVKQNQGKVISALATLGFYDVVIVASYPDQDSAFRASTALKTQNNWITETMAATDLASFDPIYIGATRDTAASSQRR